MKLYYLNSTHWDREWYVPFQHFRYNLAETLNELIDILEKDPEYKIFTLDGQTIVLEDYAEVEPENAQKLREFIKNGRIVVGPWYVMPDEFLVSGESLIKNLNVGHKIAEEWGTKPLKYGYANDIFGHIAQLPQILKGFGIEGAYIGRGLGNTDYSHFVWKSPDGTECLTSIGFYGAFISGKMKHYGTEEFPDILKEFVSIAMSRSEAPVVFFSNTYDHTRVDSRTPEVMRMIKEQFPDLEIVDAKISDIVEELKKHKDVLPVVEGELSEPRDTMDHNARNLNLLYHCLSAHYPLKQQNDRCQNMLENKVEPMLAMSKIEGKPFNRKFVDVAYKWLLQNHPHDSICGCSIDRVHGQMAYRFEQAEDIANRLFEEFCLKQRIESDGDKNGYSFKIYNTLPFKVGKTHTVKIPFKKRFSTTCLGYANKESHNNFKIFDDKGNEISYQINGIEYNKLLRTSSYQQRCDYVDYYDISFFADIPACGYKALKIVPEKARVVYTNKMPCGANWAENDLVKLEILPNGQLKITDKQSGKVYDGLNAYVDNGEVGDGWHHETPMNDFAVTDFGANCDIRLLTNGVAKTVFEIRKVMKVPKNLDRRTLCRSKEDALFEIVNIVTLERDSSAVKVETKIDNTASDHRLKVLFPTFTKGDEYFAGQAFCKVVRSVGLDPEKLAWDEPECIERNTNGIIGKQDENGLGLAFISAEGIHEAGVWDDCNSTMAVTLFRSFERVYMQPEAKMSQLNRNLSFEYKIVPLNGETYGDLLNIQHSLKNADFVLVDAVNTDTCTSAEKSYFELDNHEIALSIFKEADDKNGFVVRLFNTSNKPQIAKIKANFDYTKVAETNLLEETVRALEFFDGTLELGPCEIKTFRFY